MLLLIVSGLRFDSDTGEMIELAGLDTWKGERQKHKTVHLLKYPPALAVLREVGQNP